LSLNEEQKLLDKIQVETKVSTIKNKSTLNTLLRNSLAYNTREGYVVATTSTKSPSSSPTTRKITTKSPWQQTISNGGKGEPYDWLSIANAMQLITSIVADCRRAGFGKDVPEPDGYNYRLIAGKIMRRPTKTGDKI